MQELPAQLLVIGASMEPTLGRRWRVRVEPRAEDLCTDDVVVIRGSCGWIVHRVVLVARIGGEDVVYHRGDSGSKAGRCPLAAVCGRVVGVLDPPGQAWRADRSELSLRLRSKLWWCRLSCRASALLRDLVVRTPWLGRLISYASRFRP